MKALMITLFFVAFTGLGINAQKLVEVESPHNAEKTMTLLREVVQEKGLNIFTEIDHSAGAENAGLDLEPVSVLIFGNPNVGTKLMQADPRMGIELPLRILVWESDGKTYMGYFDPEGFIDNYELDEELQILQNIRKALGSIVEEVTKK